MMFPFLSLTVAPCRGLFVHSTVQCFHVLTFYFLFRFLCNVLKPCFLVSFDLSPHLFVLFSVVAPVSLLRPFGPSSFDLEVCLLPLASSFPLTFFLCHSTYFAVWLYAFSILSFRVSMVSLCSRSSDSESQWYHRLLNFKQRRLLIFSLLSVSYLVHPFFSLALSSVSV